MDPVSHDRYPELTALTLAGLLVLLLAERLL
jgi:hypothetical protein